MEAEQPGLRIFYARAALRELNEVWEWNAERYGPDHAEEYVAFLRQGIGQLALDPLEGREVEGFPELRRVTLARQPRGDGHVVIYEAGEERLDVLHIYHTKQDIRGRLTKERI